MVPDPQTLENEQEEIRFLAPLGLIGRHVALLDKVSCSNLSRMFEPWARIELLSLRLLAIHTNGKIKQMLTRVRALQAKTHIFLDIWPLARPNIA